MTRCGRTLVAVACLGVLGQYAWIAATTLGYRYQLEWMEGGVMDVVARARAGQPIYVPPSVEYVPHVYPPLYFHVTACVSRITGLELIAGRVVSLAATLATSALLFNATRRATRSTLRGLVSVALFIATYELTSGWFHLARVDMLFVALLLAGALVLRDAPTRWSGALAGALLALAFFTKQPALFAALPLLGLAILDDARRAALAFVTFGALAIAGVLALSAASDGWFAYYTLDLPSQHPLAWRASLGYLAQHAWALGPSLAAASWVVWRGFARRAPHRGADAGVLVGFATASVIAFAHAGAETNAVLPLVVAVALFAPHIDVATRRRIDGGEHDVGELERDKPRALRHGLAIVGLVSVLALLTHATSESLPPPDAERRGDAFLEWVGHRDGEVLLPDFRFLPRRVHKRSFGLGMAARDVLRAERGDRGREILEASLAHALTERRFSTVVLSQQDWLGGVVELAYEPAPNVDLAPWPVSGYRTRPTFVWVRSEAADGGE